MASISNQTTPGTAATTANDGTATAKPLALHPMYSVANIQNKVRTLDGTKVTYSQWVKLFTLHAKGYKVLHHIDGTTPPATDDSAYETWVKIDLIVLQWIYGTLGDDILTRVLEANTTARNAWLKIQDIYLSNKGVRVAALEQKFTNLTLAACSSLDDYCKKLKDLAEQLGDVDHQVPESRLVTQLVWGLPQEYDITASLINQKSPGWDKVQHQRTKHVEIDIHFVREKVQLGHVRVLHVPSSMQYADVFTKGLPRPLFQSFRASLSVLPPPAQTAGILIYNI